MDQKVLIFVALICLSSPSYGRSWLGPEGHPSDNGFAFTPHHNHKGYGDQETDYDSSEEDWDRNNDYTNYHRHDYGHHGYNHHVNHDHHYGSHEFDYHHHHHHNFGNVHNHGRHENHEDHHNHNNPELGICRHNHNDRPNYQDHGQNSEENLNAQNRGTTETVPQNRQGNINNEPNANPRASDKENGGPTVDSLNIGSSNVNPGSPDTEPTKSGLPNGSPGLPREVSMGDSDRVVFPDSLPALITSSPLQPRLLSTPEPTTQAPLQDLTTQAPKTEAPVQAPTTPALSEVVKCVRACPATSEYNPVCGSNNVTYNNPGFLQCARNCGVDVTVARQAPCPRAIPLHLLKLLAETFNVTMEDQGPRSKRASDVVDDVTNNSKKAGTFGKHKTNTEDLPKLNFTLIEVLESAFDDYSEQSKLAKKLKSRTQSSNINRV